MGRSKCRVRARFGLSTGLSPRPACRVIASPIGISALISTRPVVNMRLGLAAIRAIEGIAPEGGITKTRLDLWPTAIACVTSPRTGVQERHTEATRPAAPVVIVVFLTSLYRAVAVPTEVISPCSAGTAMDIASQEMVARRLAAARPLLSDAIGPLCAFSARRLKAVVAMPTLRRVTS